MKRLTDIEAKSFYQALTLSIDPKDIFLQLLFETGARVSETLTLSAEDLLGRALTIAPLKNSLPRTVTVSPNLESKLRALPPMLWAKALTSSEDSATDSLRRALDRHMKARTKALLQRSVNLHALRHTAFSRLYSATKDLLLVKQWAGHRSVNSTMVYMALDREEAANRTHEDLLKNLA